MLTASINLDKLTLAYPRNDNKIIIYTDDDSKCDEIDISDTQILDSESGSSLALIRGVAAKFKQQGYNIGGFEAYIDNRVLMGSGLSSSASFEVLIGSMLNYFYNDNKITPLELAIIGQYAENVYFGKPCGLMDQIGCAVGGIVSVDFASPSNPKIENVKYDFAKNGYTLMVVDTKGDHADLTDEYAACRIEMESVAKFFGKTVCREITKQDVLDNIASLKKTVGDRAILRAVHFFDDSEVVVNQIAALKNNDIKQYLRLTRESGLSSYKYLQNVYSVKHSRSMGVALGYMLSENFLSGDGAVRVHGGGFAGTIEVFVPNEMVASYTSYMDNIFTDGSTVVLNVRQVPVGCF